ncbi:MAG: MFS family permease, partial [Gammaproteobacteria bacterium]
HGLLIGMLGNGAVMVSLIADITRWFNANRGIAVAIVISGNYAAGTLWPTFVQHGIGTIGWRDTYHVIAGICLIGMSLLALVMWRRAPIESGSQEPTDTPGRPLRLTPRAAQLFLCAAGFGCCTAMAMPQAHIVAHATDLGHAATQGAQMLSLMLGCGVISRLGFGWLSDHIGGLRTILVGAALQAVALASFMPLTGIDALYWASALFGLAQGGIVPAYAIIIRRHFPASDIGWRVGLIMFFTLCGMAFGGWVAGALYDLTGSYQAAFINALVFNALNIVIVIGLLANTGFAKQA